MRIVVHFVEIIFFLEICFAEAATYTPKHLNWPTCRCTTCSGCLGAGKREISQCVMAKVKLATMSWSAACVISRLSACLSAIDFVGGNKRNKRNKPNALGFLINCSIAWLAQFLRRRHLHCSASAAGSSGLHWPTAAHSARATSSMRTAIFCFSRRIFAQVSIGLICRIVRPETSC